MKGGNSDRSRKRLGNEYNKLVVVRSLFSFIISNETRHSMTPRQCLRV